MDTTQTLRIPGRRMVWPYLFMGCITVILLCNALPPLVYNFGPKSFIPLLLLCLLIFVFVAFTWVAFNPATNYLCLTTSGLELKLGFRKATYAWKAIKQIKAGPDFNYRNPTTCVFITFHQDKMCEYQRFPRLSRLLNFGAGHTFFPNYYAIADDQLITLLNQWKERYGDTQ